MCSFDISQFRAVIYQGNGLQKISKYRVRFPPPPFAQINDVRYLEFYCNMADLPGVQLATRPIVRYGYGTSEKKPMFAAFNDCMMNFYADGNAHNLGFFHDWLIFINNFQMPQTILNGNNFSGVYELAYKSEYAVDAEVALFEEDGTESYVIMMRDFFPTVIPETKLSWEQGGIMNIIVMFSFTDWYLKSAQEGPPTALDASQTGSAITDIITEG